MSEEGSDDLTTNFMGHGYLEHGPLRNIVRLSIQGTLREAPVLGGKDLVVVTQFAICFQEKVSTRKSARYCKVNQVH